METRSQPISLTRFTIDRGDGLEDTAGVFVQNPFVHQLGWTA